MIKNNKLLHYFLFIVTLLMICVNTSCNNNKKPIECLIEFINPDTGQAITPINGDDYSEIYATAVGKPLMLAYKTVRKDTKEEVSIIDKIFIEYDYQNLETGEKTTCLRYMDKPGDYDCIIKNCLYDEANYRLSFFDITLKIHLLDYPIQEATMNTQYTIDDKNLRFSFVAPYSTTYTIYADTVSFKIDKPNDEYYRGEINDDGLEEILLFKGEKIIINLDPYFSDHHLTKKELKITCTPSLLKLGVIKRMSIKGGKEEICKFIDKSDHTLAFTIDTIEHEVFGALESDELKFNVYDQNGKILGQNITDGFEYKANQEIYIEISSKLNFLGNFLITDNVILEPGKLTQVSIKANSEIYLTFKRYFLGEYELVCRGDNIGNLKITIIGAEEVPVELGEKIFLAAENDLYGVRLLNCDAFDKNLIFAFRPLLIAN